MVGPDEPCTQYKAGIKTVATFPTFVGVKMRDVNMHAEGTIVNSFFTTTFRHWLVFWCVGQCAAEARDEINFANSVIVVAVALI